MYSISQTTKEQLTTTMYNASVIIALIPESFFDKKLKKLVENVLHDAKNQINLLDNLIATQEFDSREFHQMD
jgi:uncharacterized protein YaaR (DUF327 family)